MPLTGLEQLVEDVVGPLHLLLLSDSGLLQQVGHNVTTCAHNDNGNEREKNYFRRKMGSIGQGLLRFPAKLCDIALYSVVFRSDLQLCIDLFCLLRTLSSQ